MSRKGRIWLIGGTRESGEIAALLTQEQLPVTVTVTTDEAQSLYPSTPWLKVIVGKIDIVDLALFLREQQIIAVVDASHPYAVVISQGAIASAAALDLPYLRYERPQILTQDEKVINLDSFATLLAGGYLLQQRVLLTIGCQTLPLFQAWQQKATLFARILPRLDSLEVALNAGFSPQRIIAMRPPISATLEKALWQQWQISLVVTKASGNAGGEKIKRRVAAELGIPIIVIARPRISYPQQTNNFSEVLSFCSYSFFNYYRS